MWLARSKKCRRKIKVIFPQASYPSVWQTAPRCLQVIHECFFFVLRASMVETTDDKTEHYVCGKLGKSAIETLTMLSDIFCERSFKPDSGFYPEARQQSSHCKNPQSPGPKKARSPRNKMLMVLFNANGIVHCEFIHTINSDFYCNVLGRLKFATERPEL